MRNHRLRHAGLLLCLLTAFSLTNIAHAQTPPDWLLNGSHSVEFSSGFEDGFPSSQWDEDYRHGDGLKQIETGNPHSGAHCLLMSGSDASLGGCSYITPTSTFSANKAQVSFWVRDVSLLEGSGGDGRVNYWLDNESGSGFGMSIEPNNYPSLTLYHATGSSASSVDLTALTGWNRIDVTYESGAQTTIQLFVNGGLEASLTVSSDLGAFTGFTMGVGGQNSNTGTWYIDDVIVLTGGAADESLLAYYPFDGTADDFSGNGNHGVAHGAFLTTDRNGDANSAYHFDGIDDFIDIPGGFLPLGNSPRTVVAWANTNTVAAAEQPVIQYGNNFTRQIIRFGFEQDEIAIRTYSDDHRVGHIQADQWYHVAFTYDGQTSIDVYLDGMLVETRSLGGQLNTVIGYYEDCLGGGGTNGTAENFSGTLDEVRIYGRALSSNEINELYESDTSGSTDPGENPGGTGLIAHWPITDGAADDISGNEHHGTVANTSPVDDRQGNPNSAFYFNGTNSSVDFGSSSELHPDPPFSFSLWMNFNDHPSYQYVLANAGGNRGFRSMVWPGNGPYHFVLSLEGSGTTERVTSNATLTPGEWYHVVGVVESSTSLKIYIDGDLDIAGTVADIYDPSSSYPLKLGQSPINPFGWGAPYHFDGLLDDVAMYDYALTESDVQELYGDSQGPGSDPDLVGHWKMDGTGLNVEDFSGRDNHGTATGTSSRAGCEANGRYFSSIADHIEIPHSADFEFNDMTIFYRIELDYVPPVEGKIITKYSAYTSTTGFTTSVGRYGQVNFGLGDNTAHNRINSATWLEPDRCYCVAVTREADQLKVYIDGVLDSAKAGADTHTLDDPDQITVGYRDLGNDQPFPGIIDDMRLYSRALSSSEIHSLCGGTGPPPGDGILEVSPLAVDLGIQTLGSFTVSNTGDGDLTWSVSESPDVPWLSLTGSTSGTLTPAGQEFVYLASDPDQVPAEGGSATILVTSNGGTETVTVTASPASRPQLSAPSQVNLNSSESRSVTISNTGTEPLSWSASINCVEPSGSWMWLSGSTSGTIQPGDAGTVTVQREDKTGLNPRHYEGYIEFTSNGGNANTRVYFDVPKRWDRIAVEDTWAPDDDNHYNRCDWDSLLVKWVDNHNRHIKTFVKFDLTDIPQGSDVQEAVLRLFLASNSSSTPRTGPGDAELGYLRDDYTYETNVCGLTNCADARISGSRGAIQVSADGYPAYQWSGSSVEGWVEDWVDDPSENYGFGIENDWTSQTNEVYFYSSEYNNEDQKPHLTVFYVPPPGVRTLVVSPSNLDVEGLSSATISLQNTGTDWFSWSAVENPDVPWLTLQSPTSGALLPESGEDYQDLSLTIDESQVGSSQKFTYIDITSGGGDYRVYVHLGDTGPSQDFVDLFPVDCEGPSTVELGGQADVTVTVRNGGTLPVATPFDVDVFVSADGAEYPYGTTTVNSLAAGATIEVTVTADIPDGLVADGTYLWACNVDASGGVSEQDESNNNAPGNEFTVAPPDIPIVTVIEPQAGDVWEIGSQQTISWVLSGGPASLVDIFVSRDDGINWDQVASLDPTATNIDWTVTGPGVSSAVIRVEAHGPGGSSIGHSEYVRITDGYYQWSGWKHSAAGDYEWISFGLFLDVEDSDHGPSNLVFTLEALGDWRIPAQNLKYLETYFRGLLGYVWISTEDNSQVHTGDWTQTVFKLDGNSEAPYLVELDPNSLAPNGALDLVKKNPLYPWAKFSFHKATGVPFVGTMFYFALNHPDEFPSEIAGTADVESHPELFDEYRYDITRIPVLIRTSDMNPLTPEELDPACRKWQLKVPMVNWDGSIPLRTYVLLKPWHESIFGSVTNPGDINHAFSYDELSPSLECQFNVGGELVTEVNTFEAQPFFPKDKVQDYYDGHFWDPLVGESIQQFYDIKVQGNRNPVVGERSDFRVYIEPRTQVSLEGIIGVLHVSIDDDSKAGLVLPNDYAVPKYLNKASDGDYWISATPMIPHDEVWLESPYYHLLGDGLGLLLTPSVAPVKAALSSAHHIVNILDDLMDDNKLPRDVQEHEPTISSYGDEGSGDHMAIPLLWQGDDDHAFERLAVTLPIVCVEPCEIRFHITFKPWTNFYTDSEIGPGAETFNIWSNPRCELIENGQYESFDDNCKDVFVFELDPVEEAHQSYLAVTSHSPVNISVLDPLGRLVSDSSIGVPMAAFNFFDVDDDGEVEQEVIIPSPVSGVFTVLVEPKPDAEPDDIYTITTRSEERLDTLAFDQLVADIPTNGYALSNLDTGSVRGVVSSIHVLLGVPVDLYDSSNAVLASAVTNDSGHYEFSGLLNGDYTVSISTPLGYQSEDETKEVTVRGLPHEVNFDLTELEIVPQQRSRGYWAHQLHRALKDRPKDYDTDDFAALAGLVNVHFNQNEINPVDFYQVPQPASQEDSLKVLKKLLHMRNTGDWEPVLKRLAKSQLMALMLNVVSGKVSQTHEVSSDGRSISQAITYCDMLVNDAIMPPLDGGPGHGSPWCRYIRASFILVKCNLGLTVPDGMIPEDVFQIAYRLNEEEAIPEDFTLDQNFPNPFNPITEIRFGLPEPSEVKLSVFNSLGQEVVTLVNGWKPAGTHTVEFNGSDLASGVYFYRLDAGTYNATKKMVLLK